MKKGYLLSLLLPVLTVLVIVFYHTLNLFSGQEAVFSISGYDPRDILAGHYLEYTVDYNVPLECGIAKNSCICFSSLEPPSGSFRENNDCNSCKAVIRGKCQYSRFISGIERYYIAEAKSQELEQKLRKEGAKIRVSIPRSGFALVKEIIWNDRK